MSHIKELTLFATRGFNLTVVLRGIRANKFVLDVARNQRVVNPRCI